MVGSSTEILPDSQAALPKEYEMSQPEILVRDGELSDAPTIANFQIRMAMETEEKTLLPEVVQPAVEAVFSDSGKGQYLVAVSDSQVVGSLLITYEWSDWRNCHMWYIQSVYVHPDFRGQGIFGKLYDEVIARAKSDGAMFVRLYVEVENERAQKTYEKLGMKRMPYYMYDVKVT